MITDYDKDRLFYAWALTRMIAITKKHIDDEEWHDWINELYGNETAWAEVKEHYTKSFWIDPTIELSDEEVEGLCLPQKLLGK